MDIEEDYFNKAHLIIRYLEGTLTDEERETLETWRNSDAKYEHVFKKLTQVQLSEEIQRFAAPGRKDSLQRILERTTTKKKAYRHNLSLQPHGCRGSYPHRNDRIRLVDNA